MLIEGNMNGGGIWVIEMAHGTGAFGERTAEVLQWMSMIKRVPKAKREQYSFGKTD